MARKPAHLEMVGGRGPRQRMWEAIRKRKAEFTVADLEKATAIDKFTIHSYVQLLETAGFVGQINNARQFIDRKRYALKRDVGVEAPRIDKQGTVIRSTANENMWRTMRIMGDFTASELAMRASTEEIKVAESTAKKYLHVLCHAGYLTVIDKGHAFIRGVGAKQTRYRMLVAKYTGPRPPMIQRTRCVYDPNLGKVVWQEEPDHDAC